MSSSAQTRVDGHINFCLLALAVSFSAFLSRAISSSLRLKQFISASPSLRHPSLHHLGSTLLCNGCSLADLLPPFFPSPPPPPLTLSLSGRSALHWACSVNHLSLTRTLIRYGAAVDLQDNKVSSVSELLFFMVNTHTWKTQE